MTTTKRDDRTDAELAALARQLVGRLHIRLTEGVYPDGTIAPDTYMMPDGQVDALRAALTELHRRLREASSDGSYIVLFDGPPAPESGRFVEVEDESGHSVSIPWTQREDGYWALPFPRYTRIATLEAELAEARERVAIMGGEVDCATMRCMDAEAAHKHAEAKCEWLANECARQCRVWTRKNCVTRDWLAAAESAATKEAS